MTVDSNNRSGKVVYIFGEQDNSSDLTPLSLLGGQAGL